MISYAPLWKTMKQKGISSYALRGKQNEEDGISSSSYRNIRAGKPITTTTIETLCRLLDCAVSDIIEYLPDEAISEPEQP